MGSRGSREGGQAKKGKKVEWRREKGSKIGKLAAPNVPSDEDESLTHLEGKPEDTNHCEPLVQGLSRLSYQLYMGRMRMGSCPTHLCGNDTV